MGKHRSLQERLDQARSLAQRNAASADKHERRHTRLVGKGEEAKAAEAGKLRDRARGLAGKWAKEARRLEKSIQVSGILAARAPRVRLARAAAELTPKQRKIRQRDERAKALELDRTRKRMAGAGMEHWDPRTATGRREFDIATMGPQLRASVNHFNACFRKKDERTDTRVLAWAKADEHFHKVHAGDIATPRYEPGVDASRLPGVSDSRLDALRADAALRADLGRYLHAVLLQVVYHHMTFRALAATTGGDERAMGVLFKRALDLAAFHFGVERGSKKGTDMVSALFRAEAPL